MTTQTTQTQIPARRAAKPTRETWGQHGSPQGGFQFYGTAVKAPAEQGVTVARSRPTPRPSPSRSPAASRSQAGPSARPPNSGPSCPRTPPPGGPRQGAEGQGRAAGQGRDHRAQGRRPDRRPPQGCHRPGDHRDRPVDHGDQPGPRPEPEPDAPPSGRYCGQGRPGAVRGHRQRPRWLSVSQSTLWDVLSVRCRFCGLGGCEVSYSATCRSRVRHEQELGVLPAPRTCRGRPRRLDEALGHVTTTSFPVASFASMAACASAI